MSTSDEDITQLTWKERRLRNRLDPEHLRDQCRGSSHLSLFTVAAALPACVLTSSAWPIALGTVTGAAMQYIGYRNCVHNVNKSSGVIPGYPFPSSKYITLPPREDFSPSS